MDKKSLHATLLFMLYGMQLLLSIALICYYLRDGFYVVAQFSRSVHALLRLAASASQKAASIMVSCKEYRNIIQNQVLICSWVVGVKHPYTNSLLLDKQTNQ